MRVSYLWGRLKRRLDYANKVAQEREDEKFILTSQDRAAEIQMYLALRAYRRTHGEPNLKVTVKEALLSDDWGDLTVAQIAEALDVTASAVCQAMNQIKRDFGFEISHAKRGNAQKEGDAQ